MHESSGRSIVCVVGRGGAGKDEFYRQVLQPGPNLAKTKILAKDNTVNRVDRRTSDTKPTHAVRE